MRYFKILIIIEYKTTIIGLSQKVKLVDPEISVRNIKTHITHTIKMLPY